MRRAAMTMLALAALASASMALAAAKPKVPGPVKIDSGALQGVLADGVVAYKGIPYAAPPTGELRWRAPQPVAPWTGVRKADAYANDCMQKPFPSDAAPLGTAPAEDCLYVNVWTPAAPPKAGKLPVMFWIHGGGFVNGGSSPAVYDGSHFAQRGIVFVSLNYRLGRFGFFAHPALTKETPNGPLGNYGYLDQIAALKWVQRNIAAFGGDPGNVTVFGESAGGGSVHMLMTSPLAKGLFEKAIVESGGGRARGLLSTPEIRDTGDSAQPSAEDKGVAFAKKNGIEGDDAAALAKLRALPAETLVNGLDMMTMGQQGDTYSGPMIDGQIMPCDAEAVYRAGTQAKVPLMIGANSRELGFMPIPAAQAEQALAALGPNREMVENAYDPDGKLGKSEVATRLMSDRAMVEPARLIARLTVAAGQPTYLYRFSYVASSLRGQVQGALHATEIPFVFSTVKAKYEDKTTPEDVAMGEAANAYWAAFARAGDPNGGDRPRWPEYTAEKDEIMDFALSGPEPMADPWKARLDATQKLAETAPVSAAAERPPVTSPEVAADRHVTLRILAPKAREVSLVSDPFSESSTPSRQPTPEPKLIKGQEGVWEITLGPVDPGSYRYRFNVDGVLVVDPRNPSTSESNENAWSLVHVPGADFMDTNQVPHGAVAAVTYYSTALKRFRRMHVYTPPGYELGKGRYPVFYLLHGAWDCDDSWWTVGRAGFILDNLIAAGRAKPMIVVMPAGHTGPFNFTPGAPRPSVDEFVADFKDDVVPYVERTYRVLTDRGDRAIAGLSMGGMQTLNIAVPDLAKYAYIGVFSSGLFGITGSGPFASRPGPSFEEQNAKTLDDPMLKKGLKLVWFATGKDDFVLETSQATVAMLRKHGFDVTFKESAGGHTWVNWREYLNELAPLLFR
jgi:para-nitrobenzyl esterase